MSDPYGVRIVDDTILPDGGVVCTVWNGRCFATELYSGQFFAAVVGDAVEVLREPLDRATYATKEEALAGHKAMVAK